MGAGKTTIGKKVARLTERPFFDLDEEIEKRHGPIAKFFEERGEAEFRGIEEEAAREFLRGHEPHVIALGGGAVISVETRAELGRRAFTVWIDVDVGHAWARVRETNRPLAQDEVSFRNLFQDRQELYREFGMPARDVEDVLLAALGISLVAASDEVTFRPGAVVADENVLRLHPLDLPSPAPSIHPVAPGESAKSLEMAGRLWDDLSIDRSGPLLAYGGGTTTDLAGFVAATYLRGLPWIAQPTTLVGQVDAAIGGKTGIDLEKGKNLVGSFHYPELVVIDSSVLATLPKHERRNGMAEVVKTGLLSGRPAWELAEREMIRACAAFKAAVCISDPYEQTGRRSILNLGHTFAHALEAASDYELAHGEAVALGLLAALRLSGMETDVVEELLRPEPARVDPERAWAAMQRDKKALAGRIRLVLLEGPGKPVFPVELPDAEVRRELERLIAK